MSSLLDNLALHKSALPISVEQYRHMGEAGVISQRTELLRGVIFKKMNKSPLHVWTVRRLRSLIEGSLPDGYYLRQEEPLSFSHSEPGPDLAVVEGTDTDHRTEHPTTAVLVVEVAVTSKEIDREKASLYAEAGVPEYWLVLPEQKSISRFTEREGDRYTDTKSVTYGSPACGQDLVSHALPEIQVDLAEIA